MSHGVAGMRDRPITSAIAFLLVVVLLLAAVSGCGGSSDSFVASWCSGSTDGTPNWEGVSYAQSGCIQSIDTAAQATRETPDQYLRDLINAANTLSGGS